MTTMQYDDIAKNRERPLVLITTGGTIDKSYDDDSGVMQNRESLIKSHIIERLRLPYTSLIYHSMLAKDSLDMTDFDRESLLRTIVEYRLYHSCPIVVIHGTDTMHTSAELVFHFFAESQNQKLLTHPIIFTGAMRPTTLLDSDAFQNVTEALMASFIALPQVYISFHSRLILANQVRKNREKKTFERI
jgi:L-asparaginase